MRWVLHCSCVNSVILLLRFVTFFVSCYSLFKWTYGKHLHSRGFLILCWLSEITHPAKATWFDTTTSQSFRMQCLQFTWTYLSFLPSFLPFITLDELGYSFVFHDLFSLSDLQNKQFEAELEHFKKGSLGPGCAYMAASLDFGNVVTAISVAMEPQLIAHAVNASSQSSSGPSLCCHKSNTAWPCGKPTGGDACFHLFH